MRPKFCYVLPAYRRTADEHFVHTVDFLKALAQEVDLVVLVERGESPEVEGAQVVLLPQGSKVRRVAGLLNHALRLRSRGFRKFFVRISVPAALPLCLLRPFGILTYYWNSGMAKEAKPAWSWSWRVIKEKLTGELPFWLTLRLVYRLVTGPERMVSYYTEAYGVNRQKIVMCYNDINPARFEAPTEAGRIVARTALGFPEGKRIVLSVHRHSPLRRPMFYYPEVIRTVIEQEPEVLFVLIGGGPHEQELREALDRGGLSANVQFLGALPNARLPLYYHAADLFMMPSWIEGFPRVLLEAMATGLPFVTTDAGGVADILSAQQQRYMVPREDRKRFADAVVQLLRDKDQRALLSVDGLRQVRRFSTDTVVRMYLDRVVQSEEWVASGGNPW